MVYREKTSKYLMEQWKSKPMYGQFLRHSKDLSSNDTWQMASERGTQERDRRDDNDCTKPNTKNKIHSENH